MTEQAISKVGKIAIGLAIIGGLIALTRAALLYSRTGEVDVAEIALGLGVPAFFYVLVSSASRKQ